MEPDIVDSTPLATVNAELFREVSCIHSNILHILEAVSFKITGFFLLVVFVVWGNDIHIFTEFCQFLRKLIDHHSKATN